MINEFEDLTDLLDLVPANNSLAAPPDVDRMDPQHVSTTGGAERWHEPRLLRSMKALSHTTPAAREFQLG